MPDNQSSSNSNILIHVLWTAAVVAVAALFLWPVFARMVSINDSVPNGRGQFVIGSLSENFVYWWSNHRQFRLIDILGGFLTDPVTLDARNSLLLHLPAIAAILIGMWVIIKRISTQNKLVYPIAVIWFITHTATSTTTWLHATLAQTWCAATGVWLGIFIWNASKDVLNGQSILKHIAVITLLCILGVFTKGSFYGWCAAGCAVVVLVSSYNWLNHSKDKAVTFLLLLLPLIIIPLSMIYLRSKTGGLNLIASEGGRYQPAFGLNMVRNAAISGLGYFATGPVSIARSSNVSKILRLVPFIGILACAIVSSLPWLLIASKKYIWPHHPSGRMVIVIAIMSFLGISATIPMQHTSELYLMGPNIGAAILVGLGLTGLLKMRKSNNIKPGTCIIPVNIALALIFALVISVISLFGFISRANNFRITWKYAKQLNNEILSHLAQLPDKPDNIKIFLSNRCLQGQVHSQYVMPPAQALNTIMAEQWINHYQSKHKVQIVIGMPIKELSPCDLVINGADLPERPFW